MGMKVIVYYHVPKCAGSFVLGNFLKLSKATDSTLSICGPAGTPQQQRARKEVAEAKLGRKMDLRAHRRFQRGVGIGNSTVQARDQLKQFIRDVPNLKTEYVFIHIHHGDHGLKELLPELKFLKNQIQQQGGRFYLFTVLRKTIPFINSHVNFVYNHCGGSNPKIHPREEDHLREHPLYPWSFKVALGEQWFQNYQSKYLLYNHITTWDKEDNEATRKDLLEVLSFIDRVHVAEDLSTLDRDLKRLVGPAIFNKAWNPKKVNVTKYKKEKLIMTRAQKEAFFINNALDRWLYDYATQVKG